MSRRNKRATPDPRAGTCGDPRRKLGAEGERRAAAFLVERGYRIVENNVRYDGVEIDLVVRHDDLVAFVEVKTRSNDRFGAPELAVDRRKQKRMIRAASAWLTSHRGFFTRRVRFDVVACTVARRPGGDDWRIEHVPGAFDCSD